MPIADSVAGWPTDDVFVDPSPELVAGSDVDALILALPNGLSHEYLDVIDPSTVVVDLSADHRFDDDWAYGLPELGRDQVVGQRRIANPGCYATSAMVALAPIADDLAGEPSAFGVSGYSGAGTDPSPKNDPEVLRDNVMPYRITGHVHEREIGHRLGNSIRFAPSVAPFERGLVVTMLASLRNATDGEDLRRRYEERFGAEPLIQIRDEAPLPRDASGRPHAIVGGFSVDEADPHRIGVVVALDNLLKGAASQATQNLNLALGIDELAGIELD